MVVRTTNSCLALAIADARKWKAMLADENFAGKCDGIQYRLDEALNLIHFYRSDEPITVINVRNSGNYNGTYLDFNELAEWISPSDFYHGETFDIEIIETTGHELGKTLPLDP